MIHIPGGSVFKLILLAAPLLLIPLVLISQVGKDSPVLPDEEEICGIPVSDYISGDFNPALLECFVSVNDSGVPVNNRKHFLRYETVEALKELYNAFKEDHPDVPFYVTSSTRNYQDQRAIWERKWNALRKDTKDGTAIALEILEFSSMPGTSRHHWGTDFDINQLTNSYYEKGEGKIIFKWMTKNAPRFGFCMPYTPGRETGYAEERWHWSYLPLANRYLTLWNREYARNNSFFYSSRDFRGREFASDMAPEYVNTIGDKCR